MKKAKICVFSAVLLAVFVVLPNFASALTADEIQVQINALMVQIKQLQEQLAQLQPQPATWCHDFNTNLKVEDKGDDVSSLTTILVKEGLMNERSSNFAYVFDEVLASAVTGFQQKYKDEILTPLSLKYGTGFVGKATRAKLNKLYGCGGVTPPPFTCTQIACALNQKTVCPAGLDDKGCPLPCKCVPVPVPPQPCAYPICAKGYTLYDAGERDANNCPIKKCIPPTQDQPPVISGVSGPTTLKVRETGTWTVRASDPENGTLSYYVVWGDETSRNLSVSASTYGGTTYGQSATFTHSYSSAGTYNPTFTVTDNQGLSAKTSISVNVKEEIVCIQVITPAKNSQTGGCKLFPTSCDVPSDWIKVDSCPTSSNQ